MEATATRALVFVNMLEFLLAFIHLSPADFATSFDCRLLLTPRLFVRIVTDEVNQSFDRERHDWTFSTSEYGSRRNISS